MLKKDTVPEGGVCKSTLKCEVPLMCVKGRCQMKKTSTKEEGLAYLEWLLSNMKEQAASENKNVCCCLMRRRFN